MMDGKQRVRVAGSVFGRTMLVLLSIAAFFYVAFVVEVRWMENLADNGTGTLIAVSALGAGFMLLFLAVMLVRFRDAKLAAALGWALTLLPAVGLFVAGYDLSYCTYC
jgi:hypothetical protein